MILNPPGVINNKNQLAKQYWYNNIAVLHIKYSILAKDFSERIDDDISEK
jgi:hypothetical protein